MTTGFHSLVQVLLEAGAPPRVGPYDALDDAVEQHRPDLVELLLDHGLPVTSISMRQVMDTGQSEMIELFLARGASLTDDSPIAWGLMHQFRPALALFKRLAPERPELIPQAEVALRHHAREGHAQRMALLIWAGADPWARGPDRLDDERADDEGGLTAIELAVMYGHIDIVAPKKLLDRGNVSDANAARVLDAARISDAATLETLLKKGFTAADLPDGGTNFIVSLLHSMTFDLSLFAPLPYLGRQAGEPRGIDSERARERMKMLHMLVAAGGRWAPIDKGEIADARRSLLKMARPYILEFVWIMSTYEAASHDDLKELLRTDAMTRRLGDDRVQANRLLEGMPGRAGG